MKAQSQSPGSSLTGVDTGTGNDGPGTGIPGAAEEGAAVNHGREDLTAFFTIGVVIDVLLVVAFLVWAVGQWRKQK